MEEDMREFSLQILDISPAEASKLSDELERYIKNQLQRFTVHRDRVSETSQDPGSILVIVLSAKATIELARGIKAWLERRTTSKIEVKTGNRSFSATNLTARDAAELADKLADMF